MHGRDSTGAHHRVTVLVDEARWPWRGERWAHLCSDDSVAELHRFAEALGLRRVSFQGDHYDVDRGKRAAALAAGAEPVGSRELVRRVRAAGLLGRAVRAQYRWRLLAMVEPGAGGAAALAERLGPALTGEAPTERAEGLLEALRLLADHRPGVRLLVRPGELAAVVSRPVGAAGGVGGMAGTERAELAALVDAVHHTEDRGTAVTELFVRLP